MADQPKEAGGEAKKAKMTPAEAGTAVGEFIANTKKKLVEEGVPEEKAIEMAREMLALGECTTGHQCVVVT